MAKRVTLEAWARQHYAELPSAWQLRKWARDGKLYPPAVKEGREYRIPETARHLDWPITLADRA